MTTTPLPPPSPSRPDPAPSPDPSPAPQPPPGEPQPGPMSDRPTSLRAVKNERPNAQIQTATAKAREHLERQQNRDACSLGGRRTGLVDDEAQLARWRRWKSAYSGWRVVRGA